MSDRLEHAYGCCRHAVEELDRLLADKRSRIDEELTDATTCVVKLRDALIDAQRGGHDVERELTRVNAVLSLVVGSHYTLVGLRWQRIEKARDELRALLEQYQQLRAPAGT
jgi:hypothetical protein